MANGLPARPTLGVLGSGQLGRMLALAAAPLGVRCVFYSPEESPCAADVGGHVRGEYGDAGALARFAEGIDRLTCEFEKVPTEAVEAIARARPDLEFAPGVGALGIAQDRLLEKGLFTANGIATPGYAGAASADELESALGAVDPGGRGAVVKTVTGGYDGKGQARTVPGEDRGGAARRIWGELIGADGGRLIAESFVAFEREVSVVCVRGRDGEVVVYPPFENTHEGGILRLTRCPAGGDGLEGAIEQTKALAEALGYVGVLTVEWFITVDGPVANEIAPRVHNSGHLTIEGCGCSQFENHVRACMGLPLGKTGLREGVGASAMVNLIGELPRRAAVLPLAGTALHLYGKAARPGRKVGHITVNGADAGVVDARLARLREVLAW